MKRITKKDTQELLQKSQAVERQDLKLTEYDTTVYYLLEDGKLLMDLKDGAKHSLLLESEAEYHGYFGKLKSNPEGTYILQGFPNTREGFIDLIKQSVIELETILKISGLKFDYDSLGRIDQGIKTSISYDEYFGIIFKWIVPFAYQVIANEEKAALEFDFKSAENVAEPYLRLQDGRRINLFVDLYEEAMEDYENFSALFVSKLRLQEL